MKMNKNNNRFNNNKWQMINNKLNKLLIKNK